MTPTQPRVCAVSFLNTVPLVWGMLHGPQRGVFDILFKIPSECADAMESGQADIGLLPCFELLRQDLGTVPGLGIACRGAVRSILLVSHVPAGRIRTLAADTSSRTSVALARIVLEKRYGVSPALLRRPPDLGAMLAEADAALLIGDPALRVDPDSLDLHVYDLGLEWQELTGLPMVFAQWAGRRECLNPQVERVFAASFAWGEARVEEIVAAEAGPRRLAPGLVRSYLTRNIVYRLGPAEEEGLRLYLRYAAEAGSPRAGTAGV